MKIKFETLILSVGITLYLFVLVSYIFDNINKKSESEHTIKLEQPEFFLEDKPTIELVLQACEYYNIQNNKECQ